MQEHVVTGERTLRQCRFDLLLDPRLVGTRIEGGSGLGCLVVKGIRGFGEMLDFGRQVVRL
jgi:hypothetical protein